MATRIEEKNAELVPILDVTSQFADGYHAGKVCRQDGTELSWNLRVATDDYSRGFRTGYFLEV